MKKYEKSELVYSIAERVQEHGETAYLVGGCVRDKLLGRENKDTDIEIHNITADVLERILSDYKRIEDFVVSVNSEVLKERG